MLCTAIYLCSCSGNKTENAENNGINEAFLKNVKTVKVVSDNKKKRVDTDW